MGGGVAKALDLMADNEGTRKKFVILFAGGGQNRNPFVYKHVDQPLPDCIRIRDFYELDELQSVLPSALFCGGRSTTFNGDKPIIVHPTLTNCDNTSIYTIGIEVDVDSMLYNIANISGGKHMLYVDIWSDLQQSFINRICEHMYA